MATVGEIRFRLSKMVPGTDLELLSGWIVDRYAEILSMLPWSRVEASTTLTTEVGTAGTPALYTLPDGCRFVEQIVHPELGPLKRLSRAELNERAPGRLATGAPTCWAPAMDDDSDPPVMQVELYPIPNAILALPLDYVAEATLTDSTAVTLLPWTSPSAIINGVMADIRRANKDLAGAASYEDRFRENVLNMVSDEALRVGGQQMKMDSRYTRHRYGRRYRS